LNSTDGSKLAGIAAGATANQADSVVNAALDDRLKKSGTDVMSGQVQLASSYAMWFGTSGYANGPTGVYIGSSGIVGKKGGAVTFSLDNAGNATFGGNVVGGTFTTGAFTGYAWPAINNYGTYLGPSGLLIGNAYNNKFFQVTYDGNVSAPGFAITNGAATFGGTLTAEAVNAVHTINLADNSVSVSNSVSGTATTISTTINVPSGQTMVISAVASFAAGNPTGNFATSGSGAISINGSVFTQISPAVAVGENAFSGEPIYGTIPVTPAHQATVAGPVTVTISATGAGPLAPVIKTLVAFGRMK